MSPQYLSPGVYVEEVDRGSKPIQAAGTSVCGFVGFTEKRPLGNTGEPHLVTSWTQYVNDFGGFVPGAFLPLSVYGYFLNGGGICYIQSILTAHDATAKPSSPAAAASNPTLQIPGKTPAISASAEIQSQGTGQVTITVEDPAPGSGDDLFKVTIRSDSTEEIYDNVTFAKGKGIRNVVEVVNKESKLIKIKELETVAPPAERRLASGTYTLTAITPAVQAAAMVSSKTFQGDVTARIGLAGLEAVDEVTMVCAPDLMSGFLSGQLSRDDVKAIQLAMIAHCELMKDRFAIIDPLPDLTAQQINDWRMKDAGYDTTYGALYYPWIWVANPHAGNGQPSLLKMPPCGHIAGLYARVDNERGVHKAPANEVVRGVVRLESQVTKGEQDILNPNGVNCIRSFPGRGIRIWGARTLSSDASWRYINVRRLFMMVEESIKEGTQWAVFEPNDLELWEKLKRDIGAFLTMVWRGGALFGLTPAEAFFVKCDGELNTKEVRDAGQVIVEIGIAPVKPAEFVIFRIGQSG